MTLSLRNPLAPDDAPRLLVVPVEFSELEAAALDRWKVAMKQVTPTYADLLSKKAGPTMADGSRLFETKTPRLYTLVKRAMEKLKKTAAAGAVKEDTEPEPPTKKAKKAPPIPRTRLSCLDGESEMERRLRVRRESATRCVRDQQNRAADQRRRRAAQRNPQVPQPSWRAPPPHWLPGEVDSVRARRVDGYFERLDELAHSFHTCPSCWEHDCDHAETDPVRPCWYCSHRDRAKTHFESNGLQLRLTGTGVDGANEAWQEAWAALKSKWQVTVLRL